MKKPAKISKQDAKLEEPNSRTLFVGNLPANFSLKGLKRKLQEYGKVLSIRVRCVAPAKITLTKKVAYLSNQVNPNKKNVNAYVVFKDPESVQKALELNGQKFEENIIQVDSLENDRSYDHQLSLFIGNLSFKATEDELREFFNDCGKIKSIRIVRDNHTGIGKGFGYVNFESQDSVVLAMEKNGQLFKNREIRITAYKYNDGARKQTEKTKAVKQDKNSNGKKMKKPKNKLEKRTKKVASPSPRKNGFVIEMISDHKNKEKTGSKQETPIFQGEKMANKKMATKKTIKSRIKAGKVKKQKKQLAEILTK